MNLVDVLLKSYFPMYIYLLERNEIQAERF